MLRLVVNKAIAVFLGAFILSLKLLSIYKLQVAQSPGEINLLKPTLSRDTPTGLTLNNCTLCRHTYLLTYSMMQSPSWEANWFAASQEIPRISRNPKVHYPTHKRPPTVSILGQPNPVHIPTSHLLKIHPNIIPLSTSRSPQWSLSLRFPHQDPIYPTLLTHTRHMPSPSHSSLFYDPHNIRWVGSAHTVFVCVVHGCW